MKQFIIMALIAGAVFLANSFTARLWQDTFIGRMTGLPPSDAERTGGSEGVRIE